MATTTRLLAFGDSLTAGYHTGGWKFHPYSQRLSNLFASIGSPVQIDTQGVSGEKVVPSMVQRLAKILQQTGPDYYDCIIILGGTNDLGWGQTAEPIYNEGLKLLYDQVLRTKARLVVMTVIENRVNRPDNEQDEPRQHLNQLIRQYATTHPEKNRIYLVDIAQEIRFHNIPDPQEGLKLWDDYIHFTPAGYDRIADLIFRSLTATSFWKDCKTLHNKRSHRHRHHWKSLFSVRILHLIA